MTVSPTLLLVEDEELNQELAKAIMATSTDPRVKAIRVVPATSLAQARAVLMADRVDMVLLDLQLPDGDGLQLAIELASVGPAERRPVVIAVTASALVGDRGTAVRDHCDGVLVKPYSVDDFCATLGTLFEN